MNNIVVGMGEALWDVLPEGKKIGGAPANFAYHISQFGFNSYVVSAVGNDDLGEEILDNFKSKKLNYLEAKVQQPTGTVQVTLDDKGIPCYDIKQDVAWDNIPFTADLEKLAENTRVLCFGSLAQRNCVSRNTIKQFIDKMPSGDACYKIFDINLRQQFYNIDTLRESIQKCNILKINDEELDVVTKLFGYTEKEQVIQCMALLREFDLKMLILTCGVEGSYVFTEDNYSFIETPLVTVADTVGAGDSFTATFISAILKSKSIPEAHRLAVEVSAFVCTQHGAMPELPVEFKQQLGV